MLEAQETKKVLFIGNSYVYTNDLPSTLKTLSEECGNLMEYEQSTPGGCTFHDHLSNSTSMSLISNGGWDYVILQEQSQLPSFPDSQVENECLPYAASLCNNIRSSAPDANIVFFMTWGRKDGDANNCQYFEPLCTYEGMDSLLYLRYMMMGEQNQAIVSPVGKVWHTLRDNHPEIDLYISDGSHPSAAGTYAAAVTFYTILFQHSPLCITNNLTLDEDVARIIRETAEEVVYNQLDFWYQWISTPEAIASHTAASKLKVYPNPADEQIVISCSERATEIRVADPCGKVVKRLPANGEETLLDLGGCQSGIYFISVTTGNGEVITTKFIKR